MEVSTVSTRDKALRVNLDQGFYGTFAEIGAGQEVVRWFFRVGGAAGTIAKSISAYDMQVSDAIYGKCKRYVCRDRLEAMLQYEQKLNIDRLQKIRGDSTAFFSFADTVSARNYHGTNECHGWLGIRYQAEPGAATSEIIIHVRMLDNENALQQEALGIVGVNLIYGALYMADEPYKILQSLLDGLSIERLEIDMVEFSGAGFENVDPRIMSLRLVQLGLSGAAMFASDGTVLQPSEHLRKKSLLVERGRFRPVTHVNTDMLSAATKAIDLETDTEPGKTLTILEIAMHNLRAEGEIDLQDFLSRAEVLASTGHTVMISDFPEYYRLAAYLSRYTNRRIGLAMGAYSLTEIFNEQYYAKLDGGLLESFGRLFKHNVKLYIYPFLNPETKELITTENLNLPANLAPLYQYLLQRDCISQLTDYNEDYLNIFSPDVLKMISEGSSGWEQYVPDTVAKEIKTKNLFGYSS